MKNNKSDENRFQNNDNKIIDLLGKKYRIGDILKIARRVLTHDGHMEQIALAVTVLAHGAKLDLTYFPCNSDDDILVIDKRQKNNVVYYKFK